MSTRSLLIAWGLFCLLVATVYGFSVRPEPSYRCEGPGWIIYASASELKRPALLVVGRLEDGRQVALPKAHIRECKVVTE